MSDSNQEFWEEAYQENAEQVEVTDYILEQELWGISVTNVLDIGCGTGKNIFKLALRGWSVSGIDISKTAIELAKSEAKKRNIDAGLYCADSTTWEPPSKFQLVISTYSLPGGKDNQKTLETAVKALDCGGTLIITEWDTSMGEVWEFMKDDLLSPQDIVDMLPGLIIEKAEVIHVDEMFGKDDHRAIAGTWANVALVRAVNQK